MHNFHILLFQLEIQNCGGKKRTREMLFLSFSNTYVVTSIVGARVNAKDNKWLTPLHRAVASCSEVSTRFMVSR